MAKVSGKTPPLERMAPVVVGVVLAHVLLAGLVGFVLPLFKSSVQALKAQHQPQRHWFSPTQIHMETADQAEPPQAEKGKDPVKGRRKSKIAATAEAPPAAAASPTQAAPSTPTQEPAKTAPVDARPAVAAALPTKQGRPVSRIITLSPVVDATQPDAPSLTSRPPITMMDVLNLDRQEKAQKEADGGADMDPVLQALEEALLKAWTPPPLEEVAALNRDVRLRFEIDRNGSVPVCKLVKASGSVTYDDTALAAGLSVQKISQSLPSSFPKDRYIVEVNFHIE